MGEGEAPDFICVSEMECPVKAWFNERSSSNRVSFGFFGKKHMFFPKRQRGVLSTQRGKAGEKMEGIESSCGNLRKNIL